MLRLCVPFVMLLNNFLIMKLPLPFCNSLSNLILSALGRRFVFFFLTFFLVSTPSLVNAHKDTQFGCWFPFCAYLFMLLHSIYRYLFCIFRLDFCFVHCYDWHMFSIYSHSLELQFKYTISNGFRLCMLYIRENNKPNIPFRISFSIFCLSRFSFESNGDDFPSCKCV